MSAILTGLRNALYAANNETELFPRTLLQLGIRYAGVEIAEQLGREEQAAEALEILNWLNANFPRKDA